MSNTDNFNNLSRRTRNALFSEGIKNKKMLFRYLALNGENSLLKIPNLGRVSLQEIKKYAYENGFENYWPKRQTVHASVWERRINAVFSRREEFYKAMLPYMFMDSHTDHKPVKVKVVKNVLIPGNQRLPMNVEIYLAEPLAKFLIERGEALSANLD